MAAPSRLLALSLAALLLLAADAASRGGGGDRETLAVGVVGFVVRMESADGATSFDAEEADGKPVALVFGSYT